VHTVIAIRKTHTHITQDTQTTHNTHYRHTHYTHTQTTHTNYTHTRYTHTTHKQTTQEHTTYTPLQNFAHFFSRESTCFRCHCCLQMAFCCSYLLFINQKERAFQYRVIYSVYPRLLLVNYHVFLMM